MEIVITKGEREDSIEARRADGTSVVTSFPKKGPVPHDAVHFFVETELGLGDAFWGTVASGRHPEEVQEIAKAGGHASAVRGSTPKPSIVPLIQSERIVECFEADLWGGNSDNESLRHVARAGCEQSYVPVPDLSDTAIGNVRSRLAAFRDRWAGLDIGGSETFHWPGTAEST